MPRPTPEEFRDEAAHQENVLQSTRGLHYVFQALFIGLSIALTAINTQIATSSQHTAFSNLVVIVFTVANFSFLFLSYRFLVRYADLIFRRGVVVDFISHLRILEAKGRLDELLHRILKETIVGPDIVFVLSKAVERISEDFGQKYLLCFPSDTTSIPPQVVWMVSDFRLFVFSVLYSDIYSDAYLNFRFIPSYARRRRVTETRNGHFVLFSIVIAVSTVVAPLPCLMALSGGTPA